MDMKQITLQKSLEDFTQKTKKKKKKKKKHFIRNANICPGNTELYTWEP